MFNNFTNYNYLTILKFLYLVETSRTKLEATDETPQPQRRLIKADINLGFGSSFEVISFTFRFYCFEYFACIYIFFYLFSLILLNCILINKFFFFSVNLPSIKITHFY